MNDVSRTLLIPFSSLLSLSSLVFAYVVIPKKNSVFAVEVNGFVSHIYGSKFQYRASERSVKKFKVKGSIDL